MTTIARSLVALFLLSGCAHMLEPLESSAPDQQMTLFALLGLEPKPGDFSQISSPQELDRPDRPLRSRTSAIDRFADRLARLEDKLSNEEYQQYQQYRRFLTTPQERARFLSLPSIEARDRFAQQRGFYRKTNRHPPSIQSAIRRRDLLQGMSVRMVVDSWGEPSKVEVAGPGGEAQRWVYYQNPGLRVGRRHVYFEHGKVVGWESFPD